MPPAELPITGLLDLWSRGDRAAFDQLYSLLYERIRKHARFEMQKERAGITVAPTDLVHDLYLKLARKETASFKDRRHFLSWVALELRHLLVDIARRRKAQIHGGHLERVDIDADFVKVQLVDHRGQERAVDVLDLERELVFLKERDPVLHEILNLRYFLGFDETQIAETLGVHRSKVQRQIAFGRRHLASRLIPKGA